MNASETNTPTCPGMGLVRDLLADLYEAELRADVARWLASSSERSDSQRARCARPAVVAR